MRLLLIEDDAKAVQLLAQGLKEEGWVVDSTSSATGGDELVTTNDYDVIVLDWLLPDRDGIDLCRELRARGVATPILVTTARDAVEHRVAGLNSGADDYLVKPFAFVELLARIQALLRRSASTRAPLLVVEDLVLDPSSHWVTRSGASISLTPKEYALLEVLMRQPRRVVTRAELAERVWETESEAMANLVDVHISNLRRKIDRGRSTPLIHTVRNHGYLIGQART